MILSKQDFEDVFGSDVAYDNLNTFMSQFEIEGIMRESIFLAHCAHESNKFTRTVENMSLSQLEILQLIDNISPDAALCMAYNPEKLANYVYAGKHGNGFISSGDGWTYRGRGYLPIRGKDNYKIAGDALKLSLLGRPELLANHNLAAKSACWWWHNKKLNKIADDEIAGFIDTMRVINPGMRGFADREHWYILLRSLMQTKL